MPACTPDRGNRTPTLRAAPCELAMLKGVTVARMPAPRPLATLRRVTPLTVACVFRLMRSSRCASVLLGLPEYRSFARRASCPPGRRAAAAHPRRRPAEGGRCGGGCRHGACFHRQGGLAPPAADQRQTEGWCGGGAEGDRTPDLVNAIHALPQLSYAPSVVEPRRPAAGRRPA